MAKIVQQTAPILRQIAKTVPVAEITGPKIQKLLREMSRALASQDDGVALAAPQVGVAERIFIIAGKVIAADDVVTTDKQPPRDLVFINPRLVKRSRQLATLEEGCLSVRWLYGLTRRSTKATVEAYDEQGKKFIRHGTGLIAQIFQHELDHLDGILFIDKATDLKEIKPTGQDTHTPD